MKTNQKLIFAALANLFLIIIGLTSKIVILSIIGIAIYILGGVIGYGIIRYNKNHLRIIKKLPDPLVMDNGSQVKTLEDWKLRRKEIREIIMNKEYGSIPDHPDAIQATIINTKTREDGGIEKTIILTLTPDEKLSTKIINFTLWLYIPPGKGPFPVLLKVSPEGTGSQEAVSDMIIQRGYIYACYNHIELDLDTYGVDVNGACQLAYPKYEWGSLAVWAWGAMRVVDYLIGESWVKSNEPFLEVDKDKIIVTGHSRRGKTALLASALDERIAMVAPNGSGCGGAGSFLILGPGSQGIGSIASKKRLSSWFQKEFDQYSDNERALTFDQHYMRALIAPRLVMSNDGFQDLWANPIGTQAMFEAAQPVFDFLGVSQNNAIHFREGGHAFKRQDFSTVLDFADKMLLNKQVEGDFYMKPFQINFK